MLTECSLAPIVMLARRSEGDVHDGSRFFDCEVLVEDEVQDFPLPGGESIESIANLLS